LASVNPSPGPAKSRKIVGRSGVDYVLLDADDVLVFQAEHESVWIITARQRVLESKACQLSKSG